MVIAFIAITTGCGFSSPCNETQVERVKSPDGKVEAVLVKKDCGATTSESFNVFIVGSGNKTEEKDLIFKADHVDGFSLTWRDSKFLEIKYKQARIFHFMNFWQSKDVDNFAYVVEVRETLLSQSHALSASDRWEK
jgi:DNA/RNA-binding domain of Phe-tRNA-synthetase-like protein